MCIFNRHHLTLDMLLLFFIPLCGRGHLLHVLQCLLLHLGFKFSVDFVQFTLVHNLECVVMPQEQNEA